MNRREMLATTGAATLGALVMPKLMKAEAPALFGDYEVSEDGAWVPGWRKV